MAAPIHPEVFLVLLEPAASFDQPTREFEDRDSCRREFQLTFGDNPLPRYWSDPLWLRNRVTVQMFMFPIMCETKTLLLLLRQTETVSFARWHNSKSRPVTVASELHTGSQ
jgi:hypothetical protein